LDEFSHVNGCLLLFVHEGPGAKVLTVRSDGFPLPRSLTRCARSFGCGERCRLTNGAEIYFLVDARKKLNRDTIRPRQSRFSIGSAPLTSITKSDAQISGGETRQDYKDTRRFPLV
ncbi:hypothetical protein NL489_26665, partial [Klebsiella pneumoniae]|nr:hypothetical protein [Klebsiella pneumoniae]